MGRTVCQVLSDNPISDMVYYQVDHNQDEELMERYDLTNEQFALLEPELPSNEGKTDHPWNPHCTIINGIFWRLHASAAWPDIPERSGKRRAFVTPGTRRGARSSRQQ